MRETQTRKADHLRICLDEDVQFHGVTNGLERYRFTHCCLPELNRSEIDITTSFWGNPGSAVADFFNDWWYRTGKDD
jgi:isopentenyl-diphosphate delta-isomerase